MGYITLAQTAEERAGGAAEVGERGGRDRDRLAARRDHRPDRDDAAGPGPPHRRRADRRRRARRRAGGRRGAHRRRHVDERLDGLVRQLLVALLGRRRRRRAPCGREDRGQGQGDRRPRARHRPEARRARATARRSRATARSRSAASRASRTGTRTALPEGIEPGLHETAFYAAPNLDAAGRGRPRRLVGARTASSPTSPSSRSIARDRPRCESSTT